MKNIFLALTPFFLVALAGTASAHPASDSHSHMEISEFVLHWLSEPDHVAMLVGVIAVVYLLSTRLRRNEK